MRRSFESKREARNRRRAARFRYFADPGRLGAVCRWEPVWWECGGWEVAEPGRCFNLRCAPCGYVCGFRQAHASVYAHEHGDTAAGRKCAELRRADREEAEAVALALEAHGAKAAAAAEGLR